MPIDLRALFVLLDFVKFRFQHFHRQLAVAPLAALGLTGDDDAARFVHDAHGGFDFVHVLSAFAAGAKSIDLDIGRIDFDRRGIRDFRNDIDAGE